MQLRECSGYLSCIASGIAEPEADFSASFRKRGSWRLVPAPEETVDKISPLPSAKFIADSSLSALLEMRTYGNSPPYKRKLLREGKSARSREQV